MPVILAINSWIHPRVGCNSTCPKGIQQNRQYIGVITSRHFYPQHLVSERDKHASQGTTVSDFRVTDSDQQRPTIAEVKGGSRLSHCSCIGGGQAWQFMNWLTEWYCSHATLSRSRIVIGLNKWTPSYELKYGQFNSLNVFFFIKYGHIHYKNINDFLDTTKASKTNS